MRGVQGRDKLTANTSLPLRPSKKRRNRRGTCDLGLDVSPTAETNPVKLVVKPYGDFWKEKRWWSKVEVYPFERDLRVYTRKLEYKFVNVQVGPFPRTFFCSLSLLTL